MSKFDELFEAIINEASDPKAADAAIKTLVKLLPNEKFKETIVLDPKVLAYVQSEHGIKPPSNYKKEMMSSALLNPVYGKGKVIYLAGGSELMRGRERVMVVKDSTTWSDVVKALS
jgi:hypothetical protein